MAINHLGPSLKDIFVCYCFQFTIKTVLLLARQLVSKFDFWGHNWWVNMCYVKLRRLQYVHSRNFIHCDLKPSNIIIGVGNQTNLVYLIDFGLSKELPSHPLIVIWAPSLEGGIIWSPLLMSYFTFFGVFYHGRAWEQERPFWKANVQSPCTSYSWTFQWSFTLFLNTATHSLLMANPTMITFITFSATSYCEKDSNLTWHLIGMLLAAKTNRVVWMRVGLFSTNAIILSSTLHGKYPTYLNHCILTMGCMQIASSDSLAWQEAH